MQKITFPAIVKGRKIRRLAHDFETFNKLNVKQVGADVYSRDPSCESLMCAYSFDDEDAVYQWKIAEGEEFPSDLEDAIRDERVMKTCWNKSFEYAIWKNEHGIDIPHEQWRDTMVLSFSLALPGSLDKAGEVVGIAEDKKKIREAGSLLRMFTRPNKPTKNRPYPRVLPEHEPDKWSDFKAYNRQDVRAEKAILRKLRAFDMPEHEWELWVIDQIINERGIPFNMRAVDAAIRLFEYVSEKKMAQMKALTGLDNPNSGAQLLPWLQERGYVFDDLKKGHVARAKEQIDDVFSGDPGTDGEATNVSEVLDLRSDTARASVKKYYAIKRCVDRLNSVLRNQFQFAGAGRTWRWAGRVFQPQNLPRPDRFFKKIIDEAVIALEKLDPDEIELIFENPMGLLVSCVRAVAQAPDGYLFYDADLNAIENRNLGWIARDKKILHVFEKNRDPYIDFATYLYGRSYEDLWHEYKVLGDDAKRTIAKPAVLGCGYQLSAGKQFLNQKTGELEATGLLGYAQNMYVTLTPEQAEKSVAVWRETFTEAVEFWYEIEKAAKRCIRTGRETEINMIRFDMKAPFMRMILPTGRALHYCRPRIESVLAPWGKYRDTITYEGLEKNQWVRVSTHGGKLTENGDQAIARDVLAGGLRRAHYRGLDVRIHVHDQIAGIAPEDEAEEHLRILQECMIEEERWHTFGGIRLPLASAGFVSKVFKKD